MKKIFIFFMLMMPCFVVYSQTSDDLNTIEYKQYVKEQLTLAIDHNKKINDECLKETEGKSLSKNTVDALENLNLTSRQVASVLGIHIMQRQLKCVGKSPAMLIAYFKEAGKVGIKTPNEVSLAISSILLDQSLLLRYKYYYSLLPKETKEKIEELKDLKEPFDVMEITKINTKESR